VRNTRVMLESLKHPYGGAWLLARLRRAPSGWSPAIKFTERERRIQLGAYRIFRPGLLSISQRAFIPY
jgi:hypothetical protein